MFHVKHEDLAERLIERAGNFHSLSPTQAELLARHLCLVLEHNQRLNLTRITDPNVAISKHILDSLSVVPIVGSCLPGRIADLGSGAGYPGIPIAVATGRHVTLVESVGKKAAFLSDVVNELGLDVAVAPVRAEELALAHPESFSAVLARALSSLPSLVELAAPLLTRGGCLIALKGRLDEDERIRAERVGEIVGLSLVRLVPLTVPDADERYAAVFEATCASRQRLPRRSGLAQKRPLA